MLSEVCTYLFYLVRFCSTGLRSIGTQTVSLVNSRMPAWGKGQIVLLHNGTERRTLQQPSIQKLVASIAQDCLSNLNEEATPTEAYKLPIPRLDDVLKDLEQEISRGLDQRLLEESMHKARIRIQKREAVYHDTVSLNGLVFFFQIYASLFSRCLLFSCLRRNPQPM